MRPFLNFISYTRWLFFLSKIICLWQTWSLSPDRTAMVVPFGRALLYAGFGLGATALRDTTRPSINDRKILRVMAPVESVIAVAFLPVAAIAFVAHNPDVGQGLVSVSFGIFGIARMCSEVSGTYHR